MADSQAKQLEELKEIARLRVDKERHQLAALRDEAARLESEQKAVRKEIEDIAGGKETSPEALVNAYAYLDTLAGKARRLEGERLEAGERAKAQREKIKAALASKIRVDGIGEK
jgi:predicted  nucleic acid-binding Zn-ribbon protein